MKKKRFSAVAGIEKHVGLLHIIFDMADNSKNNTSADGRKSDNAKRKPVLWLVVALLILAGLIIGAVSVVFLLLPQWFEKNPRMTMRRIELTSRDSMDYKGYWSDHKRELRQRLGLRSSMSLWSVDPGALRGKLEDPKRFSSIQSAQVHRVPPDTLRIELTERSPLAFVGESGLVVDETCMLIRRRESIVAGRQWDGALPRISGISALGMAGVRDDRLAPAVALIMESRKNASDIDLRIIGIELRYPEKMLCRFRYDKSPQEYNATFPVRHYDRKIAIQMQALKAALIKTRAEDLGDRDFDLSFDGQVVLKKRQEPARNDRGGNTNNNTKGNNKSNRRRENRRR